MSEKKKIKLKIITTPYSEYNARAHTLTSEWIKTSRLVSYTRTHNTVCTQRRVGIDRGPVIILMMELIG